MGAADGNRGVPEAVARATAIQHEASRPDIKVALKAGAGSGKTHALINRFLRLCLERPPAAAASGGDGPVPVSVRPRSILAVTFTRKAAVEIKERLLGQAMKLAVMDDAERAERLRDLFGRDPVQGENKRAAGLYREILEYPQGLKIGTIHHFCQMILGRFAVEAGLDPGYAVIEDASELEDEALDEMEKILARNEGLSTTARRLGKDPVTIRQSLRRVFNNRMRLERWAARAADDTESEIKGGALSALAPALGAELRRILFADLPAQDEPDLAAMVDSLAAALEEFAGEGLDRILQTLGTEAGNLTDRARNKPQKDALAAAASCRQAAATLRAAAGPAETAAAEQGAGRAVDQAKLVLLTKAGDVRKFAQGKNHPELKEHYNELVVTAGAPILDLARSIELRALYLKNTAFLELGLQTLDIYQGLKQRDRVVDFQDLEGIARRLMGDRAQALSLLFRLDDSITHIMVDEFQDTNANQYDILRPFKKEFLSGGSGQTALPTVFFVGDTKQSIYGFRGAEPGIFRDLIREFAARERSAGDVRVLTLPTNFRSLPTVVQGVGQLFAQPPLAEALAVDDPTDLVQLCKRNEGPGLLCVMPPFVDPDGDRDGGDLLAAEAAAKLVRRLVESGTVTWDQGAEPVPRPLRWSDMLVLFRARTRVGIYEDAFRRAGIPINPSGRGALAASREVQDLMALLRWLIWPEDDIALATVLRSPLFRLSQQDLQEVLARRGILRERTDGQGYRTPAGLWESIRGRQDDPVIGRVVRLLTRWRKRSGYDHGHDLVRRIFREGRMLERYRAARGDQAVYNLERIHDLTLGRDLAALPTARRLLQLLERAARRGGQEEGIVPETAEGGRVRFMTIHGAKGLEAPVVLLVDADTPANKEDAQVILNPDDSSSALLYVPGKKDRQGPPLEHGSAPDAVKSGAQAAAGRSRREEANLQYVAMTRARDRLYIMGGDKSNGSPDYDSPLRRILDAAGGCPQALILVGLPPELEADPPPGSATSTGQETVSGADAGSLPGMRFWQPPVLRERIRILTPSGVDAPEIPATEGAPQDAACGEGSTGISRGLQVHALLEAAARNGHMPPGQGPAWEEAGRVFTDEKLAWIFHPEQEHNRGLSEVPVIAERPAGDGPPERITGVIDRLVLGPDRVDIIDYKTNRGAQDPVLKKALIAHYRPQLALYQEAVALLYPHREIRAWLLFTDPGLAGGPLLEQVD